MKILFFGNIGAGKTSVITKLNSLISWKIIAIDNYRRVYGDGTMEGELKAKHFFLNAIDKNENQIIECLGLGKVSEELFDLIIKTNQDEIICVILKVPIEVCLKRIKKRVWDIPFPKPLETIYPLIDKMDIRIKNNEIEKLWINCPNVKIISCKNMNYNDLKETINLLIYRIENKCFETEYMLNEKVQHYYGNEYYSFQNNLMKKKEVFVKDSEMIANFLKKNILKGNVVDIGSGNCQWFDYFKNSIDLYFALDANEKALKTIKPNKKIIPILGNIFDEKFNLYRVIPTKINYSIFSFFLSHFSNHSISKVLSKLDNIQSIIIIDTFWSKKHRTKYKLKELSNVRRKISDKEHIYLPKRFFEYADIEVIFKPFNYKIKNFLVGNYWFVCELVLEDN